LQLFVFNEIYINKEEQLLSVAVLGLIVKPLLARSLFSDAYLS